MADNARSKEIGFYKPEKRFIIPINNFHIPKKLFSLYKKNNYKLTTDKNFSKVIENCSLASRSDKDTWINDIIIDTYEKLFYENFAHSIECYENDLLIGGLYGIHIGGCFFGESMFSYKSNTSKLCLLYLISILKKNQFHLLDSQFYNPHLTQFGAYEIDDKFYQERLKEGLKKEIKFINNINFQKSLSILQSISQTS